MSEQGESEASHDFIGSEGVSHEAFFEAYEAERGAPWDVGMPQPAVIEAIERGWFASGPVLDAGCGTGVNLIPILQSSEHDVVAIDCVPAAVDLARERVNELELSHRATFGVCDLRAFSPATSSVEGIAPGRFGSILDSGVLHVFSDRDRAVYLEGLAQAASPGASLVVLVFSERERRPRGPRRMSESELRTLLPAAGWRINELLPHHYQSHPHPGGAEAWLVYATRTT
jgi:SAM-dependent methyltransferase